MITTVDHISSILARPSPANSIESFQQLYFTKSSTPMKENQRVIERWSSMEQPTLTFYR